jgi:hypothetical protein
MFVEDDDVNGTSQSAASFAKQARCGAREQRQGERRRGA